MAKRLQSRRLLLLAGCLCAAFAGLGYRLVDLQVMRHEELGALSEQKTQHEIILQPRRGDILDVKGNLLATSAAVKTVCGDPVLIDGHQAEVARVLAPLLHTNEAAIYQRLQLRASRDDKGNLITNRHAVLKRKVTLETWASIQSAMRDLSFGSDEKRLPPKQQRALRDLRLKGVFDEPDQLRTYPNQRLAAHVLGYVGLEDSEVNGMPVEQTAGKDGIELSFNSKLEGIRGWRLTERDVKGREIVPMREQDVAPWDGLNVVLTIDSVVQQFLETALAEAMEKHSPISISGIAVRPRTGEILAMATLPNFDPNNPGAVGADARRNRVITDITEPGSTFKIVVVAGALEDNVVRSSDSFDCENGRFAYAGRILHDHEPYRILTVQQIITKSSNIGAAKIGIKLGENRLYDHIRDFGFGTRTGLPIQGEVSGIVHPVKQWSKVSIAQIPMGHGVAVTRMQMIMAMCALANKGWLMRPMLVDRLEDSKHNVVAKYAPQRVRQIVSEPTANQMVTALKTVVSPVGTAPKAALEHYTVAGKTGTAQKPENGGYAPGKFVSSFIGFFPADDPEICISLVMDEPAQGHYGGQIAAPVFKQIAERVANYLNIRPDVSPDPGLPEPVAADPGPSGSRAAVAKSP